MRKLFLILLVLSLAWLGESQAADLNPVSAVNKAGRQRMLSQRIVKSYALLGLGVAPGSSEAQLREALAEFDGNLAELLAYTPDGPIHAALAELERLWQPFRRAAAGPLSHAGARLLLAREARLLPAAERVVRLYQEAAGASLGRLVNLSGRQRMLSQRLAKLYLLEAWGIRDGRFPEQMRAARAEFENAFWELEIAPQNDYETNRALESASTEWNWLVSAMEQEGDYRSYVSLVNDASENLLNSMDFLTSLYEEQGAR